MAVQEQSKAVNILLWITQIFLAIIFIWAGAMKLFQPEELPWLWVKENPGLVKVSGIFDLLAGFGLTLPSLLRIQPKLTVYAAYGAITLMIAASVFHIMRGEGSQIGFNIVILIAALFIVWGRRRNSGRKKQYERNE